MKSWNMEDQLCPSGSKAEMSLPENKPSALVPGCVREPGEMEVNTDASFSSNLQYFTCSHLIDVQIFTCNSVSFFPVHGGIKEHKSIAEMALNLKEVLIRARELPAKN